MNLDSKCIIENEKHLINQQIFHLCKYDRPSFCHAEWDEFLVYDDDFRLQESFGEVIESRKIRKAWFSEESVENESKRWLVLDENLDIVGRLALSYYTEKSPTYADNKTTCDIFIDVKSTHHHLGLGTLMLEKATKVALDDGKEKFQSSYILDNAASFCKKYGFKIASSRHISRLKVENIDVSLMKAWAATGEVSVYDTIPDNVLENYCEMYTSCGKMAPDYEGDYTASEQMTSDSRRRMEKEHERLGIRQLTAIVKNKDDEVIGMTEMAYYFENPRAVYQELTGVLTDYRGRGIGKRLKGALIHKVLQSNKHVEFFETANSDKNLAMLSINEQMGYQPYVGHYLVTGNIKKISHCLE